jgi:hypothetical protein
MRERLVDPDLSRLRVFDAPGAQGNLVEDRLTVNLFADLELAVTIDRREPSALGQLVLVGHVDGDPMSGAYFVIDGDVLAADILLSDARYEVRYAPGGHHVVRRVDPQAAFRCDVAGGATRAAIDRSSSRVAAPIYEGEPVTVDLLVVYSLEALAGAGTTSAVHSQIALAVSWDASGYGSHAENSTPTATRCLMTGRTTSASIGGPQTAAPTPMPTPSAKNARCMPRLHPEVEGS